MNYDEYSARLNDLRKDSADNIRIIVEETKNDYLLIAAVHTAIRAYGIKARKLIAEYNTW